VAAALMVAVLSYGVLNHKLRNTDNKKKNTAVDDGTLSKSDDALSRRYVNGFQNPAPSHPTSYVRTNVAAALMVAV